LHHKALIFIPTYNEVENVKIIFQLLKSVLLPVPFDILFLDDNSPDGTGHIIDQLAKEDSNTFAIHRSGKLGIGTAHQMGIAWAYEHDYSILITMDCDLTHSPEYISEFYKAGTNHTVVIGSRYMSEDSLKTWNLFRKTLTRFGHFLTQSLLDMPFDASGAFRLYNLQKIHPDIFDLVQSKSYSFFFESLLILHLNQIDIKEIPISLPKRTYGSSKMNFKDAWVSLRFLFRMFRKKTFAKRKLIYG
jgi:dolichol-phosphate mannosyltransferase